MGEAPSTLTLLAVWSASGLPGDWKGDKCGGGGATPAPTLLVRTKKTEQDRDCQMWPQLSHLPLLHQAAATAVF